MNGQRILVAWALAGLVWLPVRATAGPAQTEPSRTAPAQPPQDEQPIPPFERGSGQPVAPVTPGGNAGGQPPLDVPMSSLPADFFVAGAQVLPEGTYVPRMVGRLVKASRGEVVFAPDADQGTEGAAGMPNPLPLMVLLPSARRDQVAAALGGGPPADAAAKGLDSGNERFVLGGQLFVYRGRSYLLCSTFSTMADAALKPAPDRAVVDEGAERTGVQELIRELEAAAGSQRVLTPGARRREKEDDSVAATLAEGSVVTNRRGRLVRLSDEGGRLAFVVDNDPDSPAMPAMVLVPCQMLEQLESVTAARGPEVVVHMSGRVLTSGNKASLLPVFFRVERRTDITPGQ